MCPHCGHCQHCGRSNQPTMPWFYPQYPTYTQPFYYNNTGGYIGGSTVSLPLTNAYDKMIEWQEKQDIKDQK